MSDRSERRGGRVCIVVSRELNVSSVDVSKSYSNVEVVCIGIMYCRVKCRLIAVYRSTDRAQQSEDFTKQLTHCLDNLSQVTWPCYITGDFNARNLEWSGMTAISGAGAIGHGWARAPPL